MLLLIYSVTFHKEKLRKMYRPTNKGLVEYILLPTKWITMQSLKVMFLKNYGYKKMHKNIYVTKLSGTARCKIVYTANIQCL